MVMTVVIVNQIRPQQHQRPHKGRPPSMLWRRHAAVLSLFPYPPSLICMLSHGRRQGYRKTRWRRVLLSTLTTPPPSVGWLLHCVWLVMWWRWLLSFLHSPSEFHIFYFSLSRRTYMQPYQRGDRLIWEAPTENRKAGLITVPRIRLCRRVTRGASFRVR